MWKRLRRKKTTTLQKGSLTYNLDIRWHSASELRIETRMVISMRADTVSDKTCARRMQPRDSPGQTDFKFARELGRSAKI